MNKTEIRKIVEKDLLEFFDAKTLLSNNQILMELCIDSTLKAINYSQCCTTLPTDEEIYSEGCDYVRKIEQPNRQPIITLRRTFKAGAEFVKKQLDN